MTRRLAGSIVVASVIATTYGCRAIVEPGTLENTVGVIVSAPVGAAAAADRASAAAGSGMQVVYVSLPSGSVPTGVGATITDQVTGLSAAGAVVDGGFDPVPIAASVGDTLTVEITGSGAPARAQLVVAAARPLKIVRTSPPSGGRDVPLNAIMVIVFSEPLDIGALTTGALQLGRDTTLVAGTVRFADSAHLRAEFQPAVPLAPQSAYWLAVSKGIQDVNGAALDSSLNVSFTTGAVVQPMLFGLWPGNAVVGGGALTLEVAGQKFDSASVVYFGATALVTTYINFYQLNAVIPKAAIATADTAAVTVTNPGSTSDTIRFPIIAPPAIPGFSGVSAGYDHTCGVALGGGTYCWGLDVVGELGDGASFVVGNAVNTTDRTIPVAVGNYSGLPSLSFAAVSAMAVHTCGITPAGAAYCWGYGPYSGGSGAIPYPWAVAPGTSFAMVSAGGTDTSGQSYECGVNTAGAAYCLGQNGSGQLGDGTTADKFYAVAVLGGLTFTAVSAGGEPRPSIGVTRDSGVPHVCGVTTAGAAYCWGDNSSGQLGDGTTSMRMSPVAVQGGLNFAVVSSGGAHTCGVTTAGAAYCWCANSSGQLGDGTTTGETSPVAVLGGLTFAMVSAGGDHTCAVTTVGAAYCWGDNSAGQLGDGTATARASPVAVLGGLSFVTVSAGAEHTCGVTAAGAAYCWGDNSAGELGTGTTTGSSVPVKVLGQP